MSEPEDIDLHEGLEGLFRVARSTAASEAERAALRARLAPELGGPEGGGGGGGAARHGSPGAAGAARLPLAAFAGAATAALLVGIGVYFAYAGHESSADASPIDPGEPAAVEVGALEWARAEPVDDVEPERGPAPAAPEVESAETPAPVRPSRPAAPAGLDEADLIDRAQRSLATSPREALRWVSRHRRAHPRGVLSQEREVIAVDALSRLGRGAAARRRADAFLARWPGSAHAPRVRGLVER